MIYSNISSVLFDDLKTLMFDKEFYVVGKISDEWYFADKANVRQKIA